ncbi:MAG: glycosyltransferase family 2 protein, partial [Lachnospiraceae bacterium]|nr:glycosyltransferase family 2 protein [Lachnospiraceae bacterium]
MNKDNLISVIIPVYNSENYLARCLYSILNNTYQEIEIICVNDGSTDESVQILAEYVKKDNRISIINKENGGLSSARNAGMKKCKGKYVTFIDSDDWVHPQYFEFLLFAMQKYDSDAVICSNIIVNNND